MHAFRAVKNEQYKHGARAPKTIFSIKLKRQIAVRSCACKG